MKIIVNDFEIEVDLNKIATSNALADENSFEAKIGDKKFEIKVLKISDKEITFSIDNRIFSFAFALNNDFAILTNPIRDYKCKYINKYQSLIDSYRSTSLGESKKDKILKSPMPGLITKIFVKPGTKIKIGDKLLILEAMKMENEIRSDVEGTVEEVFVNEGAAVEKDASLLKISTN
ncbi:acetyl-CoA carboxylase biotin carboxyl carrier protein subunit [Candidatus Chrysopegis kryptomonas]|uniref:Biotin-requiring enzyme n=1 Tax=Candidatus Chryseopegocella kryptomonas TaxID=1633643 RepID=A0A0P1MZZ2_9BACT|nr:acetyl-CoA carboxylase biotin carboxyl carrier protein subunit [Candidatus Chrysopegis kryptomonas]CUT01722.1 Biotin-requiring enzyme [Candidatus Chrysopegis kryptomonas]